MERSDYDHYRLYEEELSKRPAVALRDLFKFQSDREPIAIDQVESIETICNRFFTGGMSLRALSPAAHETIAIALKAPGADIVGFEHVARSAADRDKVQTAIAKLARPLALFALPEAAQCQVARAEIERTDPRIDLSGLM